MILVRAMAGISTWIDNLNNDLNYNTLIYRVAIQIFWVYYVLKIFFKVMMEVNG